MGHSIRGSIELRSDMRFDFSLFGHKYQNLYFIDFCQHISVTYTSYISIIAYISKSIWPYITTMDVREQNSLGGGGSRISLSDCSKKI